MSRSRRFTLAAAALLSAIATFGPAAPAAQATGTLSEGTVLGGTRSYWEYVPSTIVANQPLVIVLHGGDQTAYGIATTGPQTYWKTIADSENMVVVYPQGVNAGDGKPGWNDCRTGTNLVADSVDDVGFIDAVVSAMVSAHSVDQSRIYVTGASNGGMMSYRLALQRSDKYAAAGAVIANLPVTSAECPTTVPNPISVAIMNGNNDPIMPYNGGYVNGIAANGAVQSTDATVTFWRNALGANSGGSVFTYPDGPETDRSRVDRRVYTGGSQGTEVPYFMVRKTALKGAGHVPPSLCCYVGAGAELFLGKQNRDIEGAAQLWAYLKTHTLTT